MRVAVSIGRGGRLQRLLRRIVDLFTSLRWPLLSLFLFVAYVQLALRVTPDSPGGSAVCACDRVQSSPPPPPASPPPPPATAAASFAEVHPTFKKIYEVAVNTGASDGAFPDEALSATPMVCGYQWDLRNERKRTLRLPATVGRVDTYFMEKVDEIVSLQFAWWNDTCVKNVWGAAQSSYYFFNSWNWKRWGRFASRDGISIDIGALGPPAPGADRRLPSPGAHTGDTTVQIALYSAMTVAFEPNPVLFGVLEAQAALNPALRIVPYNVAVLDEASSLEFKYNHGNCNGGLHTRHANTTVVVRAVTLHDHLVAKGFTPEMLRAIRFVKIDGEGTDVRILKSMEVMFKALGVAGSARPIVQMEWYNDYKHEDETQYTRSIFMTAKQLNYDVFDGETGTKPVVWAPKRTHDDLILRPRDWLIA